MFGRKWFWFLEFVNKRVNSFNGGLHIRNTRCCNCYSSRLKNFKYGFYIFHPICSTRMQLWFVTKRKDRGIYQTIKLNASNRKSSFGVSNKKQNIDSKINVKTNSPSFSSMFIAEFMEFDAKRHKA